MKHGLQQWMIFLICVTGLSACASRPYHSVASTRAVEVRELGDMDAAEPVTGSEIQQDASRRDDTVAMLAPRDQVKPMNPGVRNLLQSAHRQQRSGDYALAVASLERALRIDPRSAAVWHQLAAVRFDQGLLDQALQLAARSNSMAASQPLIQVRNWRLIASVKQHGGDERGAREALRLADSIARQQPE